PHDPEHLAGRDRVLLDVGEDQPTEAVVVQARELAGDLTAFLTVERAEQLDDDVLGAYQALMRGLAVVPLDPLDAETDELDGTLVEHHDEIDRAGGLDLGRTILLIRIREHRPLLRAGPMASVPRPLRIVRRAHGEAPQLVAPPSRSRAAANRMI